MKYSFVTVAQQKDLQFLRLQARSMRRYLCLDLAAEILIIENPTVSCSRGWSKSLRPDFGDLANLVRFIEAKEIANIPERASGWFSQQILKLMVSQLVTSNRYVLLDAKNHLVFPLTRTFIEADNKIRSYLVNYEGHPLEPYFNKTLRYFDLDPAEHRRAFLPTVTPFILPTTLVRDLVQYVAEREDQPFPVAFLNRGFTEFFLFGSFISSGDTSAADFYDFTGARCPTVWEESAAAGTTVIARLVAHGEDNALPFFAVHRRALPKLNDASCSLIAEFWQHRGLFNAIGEGINLLRNGHDGIP